MITQLTAAVIEYAIPNPCLFGSNALQMNNTMLTAQTTNRM